MRLIMDPGDIFTDAAGITWVVNHPGGKQEATHCQLVWMHGNSLADVTENYLTECNLDHPESDANVRIPLFAIPQPYKLVVELDKEN